MYFVCEHVYLTSLYVCMYTSRVSVCYRYEIMFAVSYFIQKVE